MILSGGPPNSVNILMLELICAYLTRSFFLFERSDFFHAVFWLEVFSDLTKSVSENYQKLLFWKLVKWFQKLINRFPETLGNVRNQTCVDFVHDFTALFNQWPVASGAETFPQLCELLLLEQFRPTPPDRLVTYLNERKVKSASNAAILADGFVLTFKESGSWRVLLAKGAMTVQQSV